MLLVAITVIGASPTQLMANTVAHIASAAQSDTEYYLGEAISVEFPSYINIDGEPVSIDDDRIENVVPIFFDMGNDPRSRLIGYSLQGALVASIETEWGGGGAVHMSGHGAISSRRYQATINGVTVEAFCVDPGIPGPEHPNAPPYVVFAPALEVLNPLRYGFPNNFALIDPDRFFSFYGYPEYAVYITRVGVVMADNPSRTFTPDNQIRQNATSLVNGTGWADDFYTLLDTRPAIVVNGVRHATLLNQPIGSPSAPFNVTHNMITNDPTNPFRFEWAAGTPAGTTLVVNGSIVATAPTNPTAAFDGNVSFQLEVPTSAAQQGQTATVNLVGVNNEHAGAWRARVPSDLDGWQGIVFYIPTILSSATVSFDPDLELSGRLRIVKTDMQDSPLGGAVFTITGPDPSMPMTVTVPASGWTSPPILPGTYTITEINPPSGFTLDSNPTRTVVVLPNQTASAYVANALSSSHFELPVEGSTGWVLGGAQPGQPLPMRSASNASANIVEQLQPGQAFRILEESGDWWRVALNGTGAEGWIQHGFALINMPDVIPSIIYDVTNARASVMRSSNVDIPNITGQRLHSGRVNNPRLGAQEYIVPVLYSTARAVQTAQNAARAQGYTIIMNESFRPRDVQRNVVTNLEALAAANPTVAAGFAAPWNMNWFISSDTSRVSNHQIAAAVDVSLGRVTDEQSHTVGSLSFTTLSATPLPMPTQMHELSRLAIVHTTPTSGVLAPTMTSDAITMQNIMISAGFSVLASEWWHFNHDPSINRLMTLRNNGGTGNFDTTAIFSVAPNTDTGNPGNGNGNTNPGSGDGITTVTFRNERIPETPPPDDPPVRIQKINAITRENIPGALMRLRGMTSMTIATGDGQVLELNNTGINLSQVLTAGATTAAPGGVISTVTDGVWTLEGLPYGFYMVEEERAPDGFSLLPQHTAFGFWVLPPTITVRTSDHQVVNDWNQVLEALRQAAPDGLTAEEVVRIIQSLEMIVIPEYEIVQDPNVTSVLITFENYPFGEVEIFKREASNGIGNNQPLAGAHFRIQGFYPGNPAIPIDRVAVSDSNGRVVFSNLPAGQFTITEIAPPSGYLLGEDNVWVVNVGWGQTVAAGTAPSHTFFNIPKSSLEILKIDAITNEPLAGAVFELFDPTTGGRWQATSGANGIAIIGRGNYGNFLYPGRTYILREIVAPDGYILITEPREIVLSPGDENSVVFQNHRIPALTIQKNDAVTGDAIANAEFTVERLSQPNAGMITGNPFRSNAQGQIIINGLQPGIYRIIETRAANGYWLNPQVSERTWTITIREGENYTLTVENTLLPTLVITKMNVITNRPIPNTHFRVEFEVPNSSNLQLIGNFVTNASGQIILPNVQPGWYRVTETRPAPGMQMPTNPVTRIFLNPGQNTYQLIGNGQLVRYDDAIAVSPGASSDVVTPPASDSGGNANNNAGSSSVASPASVTVTDGDQWLVGDGVWNFPLNSIVIKKSDANTGTMLSGATFELRRVTGSVTGQGGTLIGTYTTGASGIIVITGLEGGGYIVEETIPPHGYTLAENNIQQVWLAHDQTSIVELNFRNVPYGSLLLTKVCEVTGRALSGARFRVTLSDGTLVGMGNGIFTTAANGEVLIPNLAPGSSIVVTEIEAPNGFILDSTPQTVQIGLTGGTHTLAFRNTPIPTQPTLIIEKVDENGRPLAGAEFELRRPNGELIARNTSNSAGLIHFGNVPYGALVITETRVPEGYMILEASRTIELRPGENRVERFVNVKLPSVVIRKVCGDTGQPLPGVVFEIARYLQNGRTGQRLKNYAVDSSYEFVTDAAGQIYLPILDHGTWVAIETRPLPGFINDNPHTIFTVGDNGDMTIIIRNYRQASLTIQKINSVTRAPLQGVQFEISRPDGTRVVNPATGFHTFISDSRGLIHIPVLPDGRYYLHETRALPGFLIDEPVIPFNIDSSSRQREHLLVVENRPASGLLILKTDEQTRRPLQGVEFEVRHADGRLVTGQILDGNQPGTPANSPQLAANGLFLTDRWGRINLNHLAPGVYHIRETRALPGFELDTTVHVVTVIAGQQSVLEVTNRPLGGIRLLKICDFTERPLFNVEFMVFDRSNNVVGTFYTDNRGIIDFTGILQQGRYTIRETRPAPGFFRDDMPRTIEIVAGQVTEIVWRNVPYAGQIQILKTSADFNEINGLPAGTPLEGAIFEIRDQRTGNLVDRIRSDHRGMAVSRPLPLGRYLVEEVQAPPFYTRNTRVSDVTIEFATQIVRMEFANQSANVGVSVTKTGPRMVMPNQNLVVYNITRLRNDSAVPLTDFYFRDIIPTDAFRVDRIVTGTFNHSLRYRVEVQTNAGRTIIVNDNLMTTRNNVLELRPAALGLASGEFVTAVLFIFGQVPAGFSIVEHMRIEGRILNQTFPSGFEFANRVDVGGRYEGEWVVSGDVVVTEVFVPGGDRLPQTGW